MPASSESVGRGLRAALLQPYRSARIHLSAGTCSEEGQAGYKVLGTNPAYSSFECNSIRSGEHTLQEACFFEIVANERYLAQVPQTGGCIWGKIGWSADAAISSHTCGRKNVIDEPCKQ